MLSKRYNRVLLLRARNIGVNGDPSTRKDGDETAPYNAPYCATMGEVGATSSRQRAVVNRWDGGRVNKSLLNQVVEKQDKQHCGGRCEKRAGSLVDVGLMRRLRGEYTWRLS